MARLSIRDECLDGGDDVRVVQQEEQNPRKEWNDQV